MQTHDIPLESHRITVLLFTHAVDFGCQIKDRGLVCDPRQSDKDGGYSNSQIELLIVQGLLTFFLGLVGVMCRPPLP